jgi:flagellin
MRINTNVASLQAMEANQNTSNSLGSSLEKLSTGLRINKASDDASGLAISDKLRTQASSILQSISNGNSAVALTQIADKAMSEQSNILDTVKTKLIQASTSTTSAEGRAAVLNDVKKLVEQLDNIASQTNYNGMTLLNGDDFTFQIGEKSTSNITLSTTEAANSTSLGIVIRGLATVTEAILSVGTVAAASKMYTFGAVSGSTTGGTGYNVGDTFTVKVENKTTGVNESFSYTVTQSDLDTSAAGGQWVRCAIATGLAALDTRITEGAAGQVSFTAATAAELHEFDAGKATGSTISAITGTSTLTSDLAKEFTDIVDGAINDLNVIRSEFGSTQNQLESSIRNMQTTHTNLKAAESVIRDVDYAQESATFNKQNIISQAGTYAISQANAVSQNVLRLLQ